MFETGAFTYASKLSSPFSSTLISSLAQEHCRHWPLQLLVVLVAWSWSGFDDGAAGRPGIKTVISQKLKHFCQDRLKILCVEEKKDSAITKFKVSVTVFDVTLEHVYQTGGQLGGSLDFQVPPPHWTWIRYTTSALT